jgi:hypothetical protein
MKINTEVLNKNLVNDRMSFKLIFIISYVVIFGVALLTIALPASQKSWLFGSSDSASFFKSVESGVYSFMSYLN